MSLTSLAGDLSGLTSRVGNVTGGVSSVANIYNSFMGTPQTDNSTKAKSISSLKDSLRTASRSNMFGVMLITQGGVGLLDFNITSAIVPGIQFSKMTFVDNGRSFNFAGSSSAINTWEVTMRVGDYTDYEILRKWHESINSSLTGARVKSQFYKTECYIKPWYPNTGQENGEKVKIDEIIGIKLKGVFPLVISDIEYDVTNSELATVNISFSIDSIEFVNRQQFTPGSYAVANINSSKTGLLNDIVDSFRGGTNTIQQGVQGTQTLGGFF